MQKIDDARHISAVCRGGALSHSPRHQERHGCARICSIDSLQTSVHDQSRTFVAAGCRKRAQHTMPPLLNWTHTPAKIANFIRPSRCIAPEPVGPLRSRSQRLASSRKVASFSTLHTGTGRYSARVHRRTIVPQPWPAVSRKLPIPGSDAATTSVTDPSGLYRALCLLTQTR